MYRFNFRQDIVEKWQGFWTRLCDMGYRRENLVEELVMNPTSSMEDRFYEKNSCKNVDDLTLDHTWKAYSKQYKDALVVPELKRIYVPRSLFECLGVYAWFQYSFPNCKIEFWGE